MKAGSKAVVVLAKYHAELLLREIDTAEPDERFDVAYEIMVGVLESERDDALTHSMDAMTITKEQVTKWHHWHLIGALFFGFFVGVFGFSWIWR